jgi:hypothetical protein
VERVVDGLERAPTGGVAAAAAIAVVVLIVAGVAGFAPVGVAGVLAGVAAALGAGVAAAGAHLRAAPLEIASVGARTGIDVPIVRFRARLGRGRVADGVAARVVFTPEGGAPVALRPSDVGVTRWVGAFTVLVPGWDGSNGRFDVEVSAREGARNWTARRRFLTSELRAGRFGADVGRVDGRLVVDRGSWDRLVPDEPVAV